MKLLKKKFIGEYVIVSTKSDGVHFGKLMEYDINTKHAVLFECRRLAGWKGAHTLYGVAKNAKQCKELNLSVTVDRILLPEVVEVLPVENSKYIQSKSSYGETENEEILDFIDKLKNNKY